jgi:hypothetical protein
MDGQNYSDYQAAPPPKCGLGAWLVNQAFDLHKILAGVVSDTASDRAQIVELTDCVNRLTAEIERLATVQAVQSTELEHLRQLAKQTQSQLIGLKIGKGIYKAKAQKMLQDMEQRLN